MAYTNTVIKGSTRLGIIRSICRDQASALKLAPAAGRGIAAEKDSV